MKKSLLKKTFSVLSGLVLVLFVMAVDASADGTVTRTVDKRTICTTTYGGATECREEEVPHEEIVHDVTQVQTGIVENVVLATALMAMGFVFVVKTQANQQRLV